jgi:hypothetical protein|tara:strand:- start:112 stop:444 length:333 start_codon:yes stop_codon:yes gene_type:complete
MKLIKMFLTVTAKGMLAYTTTESKDISGSFETFRMVTYNNNQTKSDTSTWMYTDYTSDDYQSLVDGGYGTVFVDTSAQKYYNQSELDQLQADGTDYQIVSSSKPVDNFVS